MPHLSSTAFGLSRTDGNCGSACAGGLGLLNLFHLSTGNSITAGLADVRAQIHADQAARAGRGAI
jgi:hypothetical protein